MTQHALEVHIPKPLEFLEKDYIAPENQAVIEREQNRWRLLNPWQRWRLSRYVGRLAGELRRHKYNQHARKLAKLRMAVRREKHAYTLAKKAGDDSARQKHRENILSIIDEARPVAKHLYELRELKARFDHYAGWLDYEAKHRAELKEDAKRDQRNKRAMAKESKYIEQIMVSVFKNTAGCHYMKTERDTGKTRAIAPKFDRDTMTEEAHYFLLAARRRFLFGYRWRLPYGVTVPRLMSEEVLENLRAATGRQVDVIWTEKGQLVFRVSRLDAPDALPKFVRWSQVQSFYPDQKREKFPFSIGVGEGRKPIWMDFESEHHLLIAGQSGSGKSNVVNGIVASLASTHSPDEMRLVLIDMKGGVEFTHWHELPHVLGDVVKTVDQVKPRLSQLVEIMQRRLEIFEKMKIKKLSTYNRRVPQQQRMARVFVLIDEMNTFVGLKGLTDEIHNLLMLLASQGRAVGINLIMATQYPEVMVVPNRIKGNMGVRGSGRMPTRNTSEVIIDSGAAADLPSVAGRFIFVRGMDQYVVQTPYVSDDDIAGVVSSCQIKYPEVSENLSDTEDVPQVVVWDEQRFMSACLEFLNGRLSSDDIHKMLGTDSPGLRTLRNYVTSIKKQVKSTGYIVRRDDGSRWCLETRKNNSKYLVPLDAGSSGSNGSNALNGHHTAREALEVAFEAQQPEAPMLAESAAD